MTNKRVLHTEEPSGQDKKNWLVFSKENNEFLTIKTIAFICGVSHKTVETWLYEKNRFPSSFCIFAINETIIYQGGVVHVDMKRFCNRFRGRWKRFYTGQKHSTYGDSKNTGIRVFLNGSIVSQAELSRIRGVSQATISKFYKKNGIVQDQDISKIELPPFKRGRKPMTIKEE